MVDRVMGSKRKIELRKVQSNSGRGRKWGNALGVRAVPTTFLVNEKGELLGRFVGGMSAKSLRSWLKGYGY